MPPHNLQAEESVLGALLLSRDAIGVVSEQGLQPNDFYRPAHQHVFDAIRALYSSGAPVDTVTVADELRRAGLLDEVGGTAALHELQNSTPAISSAAHYAKIVQDTAMLRRLIYVAGDIAELAYGEPDDVTKALDEAESKVFQVAEQRVTDSTRQIEELLSEAMDRLQETFDRGDTITGAATGYHDVDDLLSGLQPSALYIVGARPAMGKCVAWDTPMVDLDTGELVIAQELVRRSVERGRMDVLAVDDARRQTRAAASAIVEDGIKPVFTVTTRSGRRVTITASHPLLTARGWQPLTDVAVGDHVAVPTAVPVFGSDPLPDAEIDLLAAEVAVTATRVPVAVTRMPRDGIARFLRHLSATDGTAWVARAGYARIGYATVSVGLAQDVAHLLRRFGIDSTIRPRSVRYGESRRPAFEVEIRDAASLLRFADEIGILGKEAAVAAVREVAARATRGWTSDTVAREAWDDVMKAKGSRSWAEVNGLLGRAASHNWHPYRGRLRRDTIRAFAEALDDDVLRAWGSEDVRWDEIISIEPAGWTQVVDFTVPQHHNFVAADMYLHNTAFGLGMATHIAQHSQKPVLVFSLEMGHAELTQRILSSEARVDSTRIRTGRLAEADWAKIGKAIGRLEVPLFLDDNPRVTVMEIRAKARRIKARYGGLALIVIDYLQLMSGGGNPENRQLEVSEISRSLKILARELEVPIVALSQLSRNLESRADKRPMLSDLRESGCMTADTRLVRADTNEEITLGELVARRDESIPVWSLDQRMRLVPGKVVNAFASGVKDTFRLRLASGRSVDASANHPFLTIEGWRRLDELSVGDAIASARRIPPATGPATMSEAELVLLGHLIGDGCTLQRHAVQYTTTDPANVAAVVGAAARFGVTPRVKAERNWMQVYLASSQRLARGRSNPIAAWLRELGAWDLRSWEKLVPARVFSQPPDGIATFLRHLWATDGSVVVPKRQGAAPRIYYATTSRRLADGVADLLLRLDIRARIRRVPHRVHRCSYHVDISGLTEQLRFAEIVGVHGARGEALADVVERHRGRDANPNVDVVPSSVWRHVRTVSMPAAGVTTRALARHLDMQYCGSTLYKCGVSRARMSRVAAATSDPWLQDLATSDVLWDRIVAIEPLGPQEVFDATVAGTHNFVANGIIAHNSLEQDADVVMFLYRDEVYNAESPDKGSAEVIVAKHRSGPIGTKRLVFLGQYTRFDNAARGV